MKAVITYEEVLALDASGKKISKEIAQAINVLGYNYDYGRSHLKRDRPKAVELYQIAAKHDNHNAEYNLGMAYDFGYGVEIDYVKAVYWYRRAAEHGIAEAMTNLASFYHRGIVVELDDKQSVYWLKRAVKKGDTLAMSVLSDRYFWGDGVRKNLPMCIRLLKKVR